ncbi:MAG: hypothetical protein ABSE62_01615 [Chthoniobacteraceae bacterium]
MRIAADGKADAVPANRHPGAGDYYDRKFRVNLMACAVRGPIARERVPWDIYIQMSAAASRSRRTPKRATGKLSHTCAICKRRFQPIRTPGLHTIYTVCPDCRQHSTHPQKGKP